MPEKRRRELPVRTCPACGGELFREVTLHEWLRPEDIHSYLPDEASGQRDHTSPTALVCLCGTPQKWNLGGIRGGRMPNVEILRFLKSMEVGLGSVKERHDKASVRAAAEETLMTQQELQAASAALAQQERAVGRLLSGKHPQRKPDNACWRPPQRKPPKRFGRDWLALELQKRGLDFRTARKVVTAIFDSMAERIQRGEYVVTPLGNFVVMERTPPYEAMRPVLRPPSRRVGPCLLKKQTMHKNRKRVVFKPRFYVRG